MDMERFVWNSGKLLILGIVAAAVLLAGASWGFRYYATHRAAKFWGPVAVQLIRDAPRVHFTELQKDRPMSHDVSSARGLTHLRNALLENRSYEFDSPAFKTQFAPAPGYQLDFFPSDDSGNFVRLYFASDCTWVTTADFVGSAYHDHISCRPISKGLAEMFGEFTETPTLR